MAYRKSFSTFVRVVAVLWLACSGTARAGERQHWMGEVLLPNASCPRITFTVSFAPSEDGAWTGRMSIPRGCGILGVIDAPLGGIEVGAERIGFSTLPPTENAYEAFPAGAGTPDAEAGVWKGSVVIARTQAVPIRMWRVSEAEARSVAPKRPQMPVGAPGYEVREVEVPTIIGVEAGVLRGVLSKPVGEGPFPGVVLVSDEEGQDADHTEGTHKPFLVLADRLTRAGYAVLRCHDRGIETSEGSVNNTTMEESAADVAAQVKFLASQPGVDGARVGALGRGEGAVLAAMAAAEHPEALAFLVLLAPAGRPGLDVAVEREARQLEAMGETPEYVRLRTERLRNLLTLAMDTTKRAELTQAARQEVAAGVTERRGMGTPMSPDQIAMWAGSRVEALNRVRYRSWLRTNPAPFYERVACPVLVLGGGLDVVNPVETEVPLVVAALQRSGKATVRSEVLAGLNHWLQPATTGFPDETDLIQTTMSEEAIERIVEFLASTTQR